MTPRSPSKRRNASTDSYSSSRRRTGRGAWSSAATYAASTRPRCGIGHGVLFAVARVSAGHPARAGQAARTACSRQMPGPRNVSGADLKSRRLPPPSLSTRGGMRLFASTSTRPATGHRRSVNRSGRRSAGCPTRPVITGIGETCTGRVQPVVAGRCPPACAIRIASATSSVRIRSAVDHSPRPPACAGRSPSPDTAASRQAGDVTNEFQPRHRHPGVPQEDLVVLAQPGVLAPQPLQFSCSAGVAPTSPPPSPAPIRARSSRIRFRGVSG